MRDSTRQVRERIELNARDHPMGRVQIVPRRFAIPQAWITPLAPWTHDVQEQINDMFDHLHHYGIDVSKEGLAKLAGVEYPRSQEPRP